MAVPSGVTTVLREAAAAMASAMLDDESRDGVFLYAVASMLQNKAEQIDQHAAKLKDPATPERVWADIYKVARAYLQEREEVHPYRCPTCRDEDRGYCTCGHYYSDHPCAKACGCTDG